MYIKLLVIAAILAFTNACSNGASTNNDNGEEIGCNQITGQTWVVSAVSCSGVATSFPYAAFTFNSDNSVTRTLGSPECQSQYASIPNHVVPSITMVGVGGYGCLSFGSSVTSCTGSDTTCSTANSADNLTSSYSICVVENLTNMRLSRTVASEDITNGVSFCGLAGQVEEVQLVQAPEGSAFLSISDGATFDYGSTNVGTPVTKTFTVVNSGDTEATAVVGTGLAAPYAFLGGAFPGTGGSCGTTIAAGATCEVVVEFNPTADGAFNDTLTIDYYNGSTVVSTNRDITGTGVAVTPTAVLTLSGTDPVDFGAVTSGMTSAPPITLTVTNTGTGSATAVTEVAVAAPFQYTGGTFPGTGGDCTATVAAAATCTLELEFAPVAIGVFPGSVQVDYNDGVANQSVTRTLTGTGL